MPNPLRAAVRLMDDRKAAPPAVPALVPSYQIGRPQAPKWDTKKAVTDGFEVSTLVYRCCVIWMQCVASVPWLAYTRGKGADAPWEPAPDHPLSLLVDQPNTQQSFQEVVQLVTAHMQLGGNFTLRKILVGGTETRPDELRALWPLNVAAMQPIPAAVGPVGSVSGYRYEWDGVRETFPADQIVHGMFPDPINPFWGVSPLMAAARVVDTDVSMADWNRTAMENRAVPDGVFVFKDNLTEEEYEEARARVREQRLGTRNAREPWVIGNAAQWIQTGMTPAEMDFIASRGLNREEICAAFGVPVSLVIGQKDNTFANYAEARRAFWLDSVIPFLETIRAPLNRALVPHFGDRRGLWLSFDTSNVPALQGNLTEKIDGYAKLVEHGVPPNVAAARVELDIDEIEGGDVSLIPATLVPLSMAGGAPDTEVL